MIKKLRKQFQKLSISTRLVLYFVTFFWILSVILYHAIPVLLNYPPDTINTTFDREVSILYYKYQYLLVVLGITLIFILILKISLRKIDHWWKYRESDIDTIVRVRKIAMSFSLKLYLYMEIFPTLMLLLILMLTGSHPAILLFKIGTIIFTFATFVASLFLVITKNALYPVLRETSKYISAEEGSEGFSLRASLIFQLFPGVLVVSLILSLIGYYRLTVEKGELLNNYYQQTIDSALPRIQQDPSIESVDHILSDYYSDSTTFCFIVNPDSTIQTSNGTELSHFFVKYMNELARSHNNTAYEAYTVDSQAVIRDFTYEGNTYTVGIYFEVASFSSFLLFLFISVITFLLNLMMIIYVSSSLTKDIKNVTAGLNHIINNDQIDENKKLPVTSNDEIGDLVIALNQVQDLNRSQVAQIRDNQDKLMEKERLASLGQLIGGIAHNMKTPIMSISGAAEGLSDLIKEYDSSIGDPEVTNSDHHDIAKDMSVWVKKIKEYTEYMSDIITAVKGQAVTFTDAQAETFTVEEFIKRVDILMRHELKNALITMNVQVDVDPNLTLTGNINSLVQVIDNMVSNAIQAYNGKTNETIELKVQKERDKLVISVIDHAGGMPKEVSDKLFKEMITTKGKNGTGLGLFMSYSNIRAHFNGNITVQSVEGSGTTFKIYLPL